MTRGGQQCICMAWLPPPPAPPLPLEPPSCSQRIPGSCHTATAESRLTVHVDAALGVQEVQGFGDVERHLRAAPVPAKQPPICASVRELQRAVQVAAAAAGRWRGGGPGLERSSGSSSSRHATHGCSRITAVCSLARGPHWPAILHEQDAAGAAQGDPVKAHNVRVPQLVQALRLLRQGWLAGRGVERVSARVCSRQEAHRRPSERSAAASQHNRTSARRDKRLLLRGAAPQVHFFGGHRLAPEENLVHDGAAAGGSGRPASTSARKLPLACGLPPTGRASVLPCKQVELRPRTWRPSPAPAGRRWASAET